VGPRSEEQQRWQPSVSLPAPALTAMLAERPPGGDDPAEAGARVAAAKREVLLRVHRHRLGFEDLEDCFSQATLELVTRARTRARAFVSDDHVANALEQRFLSRISDRRRAVSGRSPIQAATHAALRPIVDHEGCGETSPVSAVVDPVADVAARLADRDEVRRLRELADELTADQRLVLACQVALDMDCQEFARASGGRRRSSARSPSAPARACASWLPTTRPASAVGAWRTTSPPTSLTWPVASSQSGGAAT
jgi:hypothetical protein